MSKRGNLFIKSPLTSLVFSILSRDHSSHYSSWLYKYILKVWSSCISYKPSSTSMEMSADTWLIEMVSLYTCYVDKSSILESSIKYIKQLEERVKILEEKTSKKTVDSAVFVNKSQIPSDVASSTSSDFILPQIETRVLDRNVLIRIQCENHKGVLVKTLSEVQKLNLSIVNYSVMSLGSTIFNVTIVTEMDEEFNIPVKDLVKRIHSSLVCSP
ncbi:hypothetical protein ACHQM5_018701 [Ranunculus cassubicifolius]